MKCLNCGHIALKRYCPQCGQKTSTHRFTLASIFDYAVVNAYLSLNAGLLFTIKELLIRPGHAVYEYLQGKRTKYLNAFSFFLVILALSLFVKSFNETPQSEFAKYDLFEQYPRFAQILLIPLLAFISYLFRRKLKLYFAEHLVIATYVLAMQLLLDIPFSVLELFFESNNVVIINISILFFLGYFLLYYYQLFVKMGLSKKQSGGYAFLIFTVFFILVTLFLGVLGSIALEMNAEGSSNLFFK